MSALHISDEQRARLVALETEYGTITPAIVVADARDDTSPLHDLFEWNDATAAEQQRHAQARLVLRSVRIIVGPDEHIVLRAPHYVRDPDVPGRVQGYVAVPRLQDDPERARRSLRLEFLRVESALERARAIASVLGQEAEIETLLDQVVRLRERVAAA